MFEGPLRAFGLAKACALGRVQRRVCSKLGDYLGDELLVLYEIEVARIHVRR